ncbi:MAG: FAD-dependent oxidoreductase [Candidatus Verstraetearchaeota archaeon]|nr:FAD-dependent oxidoreductase [Candidatus Verstraetearchaeota archaeon]
MDAVYDVAVIGGGPAGVTAAIYTKRKLLRTILITKDIGGQVLLTANIENYPGFVERSGGRLADYFEQQLSDLGVDIAYDTVRAVSRESDLFRIECEERELLSRTVIATGGSSHKRLDIPGEKEFFGKGVFVCATCDAPLTKNKVVAVVGGGNAAFQSAELLSKYATKVYLLHRRSDYRADGLLVERVKRLGNVEMMRDTVVKEIKGKDKVEAITVEDLNTGRRSDLVVQRVFVEIGRELKVDYLKGLVKTNERGQVVVDKLQRTSCEGVFAAGEITDLPYGQAIISAGQGAVAGLAAFDYLASKKFEPT